MEMTTETHGGTPASEPEKRIIKRYSNRKLYDTKDSRYVTLAQIAELVRAGEEVQIIDNATKEDKTEATLALIISEEVKSRPKAVPLSTLRDLVHARGEKILSQLREGPIGRLFPVGAEGDESTEPVDAAQGEGAKPATEGGQGAQTAGGRTRLHELVTTSKQTLEEWQAAIDERVQAILPSFFRDHQTEVKKLTQRIEALEAKLAGHGQSSHQKGE